MTCRFAHEDGVYLLGALPPTERLEFERHLAGCSDCSRRVRELAGLTGLLARVSPAVLDERSTEPGEVPPVPDSVLPGLVEAVRRDRGRRRWLTAGLAAAAVVAGAVIGVVGAGMVSEGDAADGPSATPPPSSSAPSSPPPASAPSSSAPPSESPSLAPPRRMRPVAGTGMTAQLSLTQVPWGTRLDLTCSYPADVGTGRGGERYGEGGGATYTLVVRTRGGELEQVATWRGLPGRTMELTGATSTLPGRISAVQVRTEEGSPVLQLGG